MDRGYVKSINCHTYTFNKRNVFGKCVSIKLWQQVLKDLRLSLLKTYVAMFRWQSSEWYLILIFSFRLMLKVMNKLNKPPKKVSTHPQMLYFWGKTTGAPNLVYTTVFTVKMTQLSGFLDSHLNLTESILFGVSQAQVFIAILKLTETL